MGAKEASSEGGRSWRASTSTPGMGYPLSPTQAVLYSEKSTPTGKFNAQVSIDDAHRYNQMMLNHSSLRVFSNS